MAKYSIILNTFNVLKDGTSPVAVRLNFGGKRKIINIPMVSVCQEDWDSSLWVLDTHPRAKSLNKLIRAKDDQLEDLFNDLKKGKNDMTPEKIIDILSPKEQVVSFYDFVIDYLEAYKKKKEFKMATNLEAKVKSIWCFYNGVKKFPIVQTKEEKYAPQTIIRRVQGKPMNFIDINETFLKKLAIYLQVERGNSERTVYNVKNFIRTIFGKAMDAKVISKDIYPFDKHKMVVPESQKIGLDKNEVMAFEQTILVSKTNTWLDAKNVWLYAFCFGGERCSDVFRTRWEDFKNGRLYYVMGKNNKPVSVEIPDRAKEILAYYEQFKDQNNGYVFPALRNANSSDPADIELKCSNAIRIYNKWLKKIAKAAGINKVISLHIARHTFGNITGDQISPQLLQVIYRHSDISTTMNYQKNWINNNLVDNAVGSIVNF